jgi:hypothetical protein
VSGVGSPENLDAERQYSLTLDLLGQRVIMTVDEVQVLEAILPVPLAGDQVGFITWGQPGTAVSQLRVNAKKPRAFAVMEFGSPFDSMYSEVIKPVCEAMGLQVERADDWSGPGVIMDDIVQAITTADLVIAEITPRNPNVYYEVGYAQASGVPTILLFEPKEGERLPFDLSGQRAIFYEDSIGGKTAVEQGTHPSP